MMPKRYFVVTLALLFTLAGASPAHEYHSTTSAPEDYGLVVNLEASPWVCVSLALTIGTASGGATVSGSGGVYAISFGNVNGLGIGSPGSGVSVTKSAGGATYTTPILITPTYVVCIPVGVKTIKLFQDATTSSDSQSAAREGSSAASVVTVPSSQVTALVVSTNPTSGTPITRYIGVFVSNANGGSAVTGALAPKLIYQLAVE